MTVPCDPVVINTDGSGNSAGRIIVGSNLITDWDTRFTQVFLEYRIRGVTFEIIALDDSDGVTMFSISEDNFGVPTFDSMTTATNWLVYNSCSNPRSRKVIKWKAIDLENLQYIAIDNTESVSALNWFTNTTTFNAAPDLRLFLVRPMAVIEFRGIGTVL